MEALVDAIGQANGIEDPDTVAYKLRSPLLLKSFARPGKHEIDEQGRRVFNSMISGYRAALFDLDLKTSGQSRAGLKPEDALYRLLGNYGLRDPGSIAVAVSFLRRALQTADITQDTPLSYFRQ
jgi:hypothetical protein